LNNLRVPGRRLPPGGPGRSLVIMAKEPRAGRVKTRLAAEVGTARATGFYRQASAAVIARLSATPQWRTVLAIAPDTALGLSCWPARLDRITQGDGDLGVRMLRALAAMPPGPAVLVGTDIPAIRPAHIATAFKALGEHEAVFGPATDGGFWLIGLARRRPIIDIFENVRWSSPHTLADVLANLPAATTALVDCLSDVDNADELERASGWFARRVPPSAGLQCRLPVQAPVPLTRETLL
jgi:rSAM/selenodomain-associated transferase 1